MTRLTKEIRERMVKDLLVRRFNERGEELAARSTALFATIYEDQYDQEMRRLIAKIKKRFRNAFYHYSSIKCLAPEGMRVTIGATRIGNHGVFFTPKIETVPFCNSNDGSDFHYVDGPFSAELASFGKDCLTFANDITAARNEVLGALSSVTTVRQLTELWPEALPILERHLPVPSRSNLPAVQFANLTQAFGLSDGAPAEGGAS